MTSLLEQVRSDSGDVFSGIQKSGFRFMLMDLNCCTLNEGLLSVFVQAVRSASSVSANTTQQLYNLKLKDKKNRGIQITVFCLVN